MMSPRLISLCGKNGADSPGAEDEFVDEQMIADHDRVLHRARRNLHCLHDEGHAKQRHDHRHHSRLEILAPDSLRRTLRFHRRRQRLLFVTVTIEQPRK